VRALAAIGRLTPSNTRPGTVGRQAADAVVYRRRVRGRPEGARARTVAGHESAAVREATGISAVLAGVGWTELDGLSRSERRRAARWNARAGELLAGQIPPEKFRSLIEAWAPLCDGRRFESDPDVVLAILAERQAAGEAVFEYRGRRL
jgi:hypothetical protein